LLTGKHYTLITLVVTIIGFSHLEC
jgi:hypothetical protein